ncbi:MAG: CRISPR-associated protein Cas2 [Candidatus Marinimicrobia bacterium]|nr:CRISPR-associated protein Cas2 [Candidatus Neomarinimicrobiota bacterium]
MVNYGTRVQYSVFECLIDHKMHEKLICELKKVINEDEDTVRSYELCQMCLKRVQILGQGEMTEDKEYYIF